MKKILGTVIAASLIAALTFGGGASVFAASTSTTEQTVGGDGAQKTGRKAHSAKTESGVKAEKVKSGYHVDVISIAASVLGISADEVRTSVKDGKVGDLLIAAGKVDVFKATYLDAAKSKLDAAVAEGSLTQEQADAKYAEAQAKMAAYDGTTHLCGGKDGDHNHGKKGAGSKKTDASDAPAV